MMGSLTIGVEFLTGRYVAASVSDRDETEWPPHPGRVFMAMAAACFETGEHPEDVAALEWLEALCEPEIVASQSNARSTVRFYVPVNDKLTVNKAILQSTPGLTRSKQERSYPTSIPVDPLVEFVWRNVPNDAQRYLPALTRICESVIRVGHSSSLVRMWVKLDENTADPSPDDLRVRWIPTHRDTTLRVRIADDGELSRLRTACNAERIKLFGDLKALIESTKGKQKTEAKKVFEEAFGQPFRAALRPPEPTPPTLGTWAGYRRSDEAAPVATIEGTHFDSELLILAHSPQDDEPKFGIADCLALTSRLRDAFMSKCPDEPPPEWLSGHDTETRKPTQSPHVAFVALPFVGRQYADGHVMGLALALPRSQYVAPEERGRVLGPLLFNDEAKAELIELNLGRLGKWTIAVEERAEPPQSLQTRSWTQSSHTWASVTPVVLDRFPKSSRKDDRMAWEAEVRGIIAQSCVNAGVPSPTEIDIDTTSWHLGSPRAYPKSRRLRSRSTSDASGRLGDGFPTMPHRPGKPTRPQVHAFVRFASRVRGPVLLGAGRFLGYGLCKPVATGRKSK